MAVRGTILSLTPLSRGYCTNVLVPDKDQTLRQKRFRASPNAYVEPTDLGLTDADMQRWVPGQQILFEGLRAVHPSNRRQTHPEDVLLKTPKVEFAPEKLSYQELYSLVRKAGHLYGSVDQLFPNLTHTGNGKLYKLPGNFDRSVGYVICDNVVIKEDDFTGGKYRVSCVAGNMRVVDAVYKDFHDLPRLRRDGVRQKQIGRALVRFALSGEYPVSYADNELRCYLMVSHIIRFKQ